MAEKENPLKKFNDHVDEYVFVNLQCVEEQITKISTTGANSEQELTDLLIEANSLIDFMCGDDDVSYNEKAYRMFRQSNGEIMITRGEEVDVDVRLWHEMQVTSAKKNADDEYEYDDDETDMSSRDGKDLDEDIDDESDNWPE